MAQRLRGGGDEEEEFVNEICYKCDKEFEIDDTGGGRHGWGQHLMRSPLSGDIEGIFFCHECWEDEADNCETDEEEGCSVWKGCMGCPVMQREQPEQQQPEQQQPEQQQMRGGGGDDYDTCQICGYEVIIT